MKSSFSSGDEEGLNTKLENGSVVSGGCGLNFGESRDVGPRISSILEVSERQRCKTYAEVLRSYEELQSQIERLEEARNKVLSYTPGSRIENARGLSSDPPYVALKTTSLLLIGPKGSGKSSLVNKISRVLENDVFGSERAQVSHDKPVVVVTHGDLLSLSDRVRIRVYLGELLSVPPTRQIYDIPGNDDSATTLTIIDMLNHCFGRADRNLPDHYVETKEIIFAMCFTFLMIAVLILACQLYECRSRPPRSPPINPSVKVDWRAIRHMWLGDK